MKYFIINSTIANVYRDPDFNSPVVSQGLLGETCIVCERKDSWVKCQFPDGYQGWLNTGQGTFSDVPYPANATCLDLYATIEQDSIPVRALALGCQVKVGNDGIISLPDSTTGVCTGNLGSSPYGPKREDILKIARRLIGIPYIWGGRSSCGLDCSGLVQLTFHLCGIQLPRDSRQQADSELLKPIREDEALQGDLFFFGTERITHVGIYAGDHTLIHAQGFVKEESIERGNTEGNLALSKTIQKVQSIEPLL